MAGKISSKQACRNATTRIFEKHRGSSKEGAVEKEKKWEQKRD